MRRAGRHAGGAEAVVDVHHPDAVGTAVEHGQQGRHAAEAAAVAHAGGHCDHRLAGQAAHHAGQGALHAGGHDDDAGLIQQGLLAQEPVQPGHTDVIETLHGVSHSRRGDGGLLRHRNVGGAGGDHQHGFAQQAGLLPRNLHDAGLLMPAGLRRERQEGIPDLRGGPGGQNGAGAPGQQVLGDACDLGNAFPRAEYHLRKAAAQLPVMVHLGVVQILEGEGL